MAELSQSDIQRAVHDATRDMQRDMAATLQHVTNLESLRSDLSNVLTELRAAENNVNSTQQATTNLVSGIAALDQRLAHIEAFVARLEQRLQMIEQSTNRLQ